MEIQLNAPITGAQVSELRALVGWNPMAGRYGQAMEKAYFTVSCWDGEVLAGFVYVVSNGVTDAYIQDVIVRPGYQRKGIGERMIRAAVERLRQEGINVVSLIFAEELAGFYEKLGFKIQYSGRMNLN